MSDSVLRETTKSHAKRRYDTDHIERSNAIKQLDSTLRILSERIIPPQPYLLSIPSDVPYRHSSRFVNTWFTGTPFAEEEEQLQYLTFLSYQSEEDALLKVVGGWADEKGNLLEDDTTSVASQSGQNTPIEQPSRKKISLQDYKTKDKTRPSTPTSKVPAEELRKKVMKAEAKEHAPKAEEERPPARSREISALKGGKKDSSTPSKSQVDGSHSPRPAKPQQRDLPSPRKKRRLSSDSPRKETTQVKRERKRDEEYSKELPLLLSPTLPARQKQTASRSLPGLLLPDLPPALERLLAKPESKKADSSAGQRSEQVKSMLGNALGSIAGKRPPEKPLSDPSANRIRSDSQTSVRNASGTPRVQSPAIRPATKTLPRPATPLANGVSTSPKPKARYEVTLRYGKKNSKRVMALLRFPPRAKKPRIQVDGPPSKPPEARPSSARPVSEATRPERKRPAESSPERPVKKVKQLETPERPKTLGTPLIKSPANAPVLAKSKVEMATPKKELKSSAMKRLESQDGMEVHTPQGNRGRISTPIHGAGMGQAKASPGSSAPISKEDRAGWQEINSKCFALGRTLKHEGTSLGQPGAQKIDKDLALSVVILIEALLCFMINHAAQSQARPKVDPGWSTIMPYHSFVFKTSERFQHLHGLVIQLGAICRHAIHHYDMERLAIEPLPFDNHDSAPTPGSDGTARQHEDFEKMKKKYVVFRDRLVLNNKELQSAWLKGSLYLSPLLIEKEYPKTWENRSKDTSMRSVQNLNPSAISRDYCLPLDIRSSAFEATRFALTFLKEWTEKEKIDWKPRIEL